MSNEENALEAFNKAIREKLYHHSGLSPNEAPTNSMTTTPPTILYRPNNYRRALQAVYSRDSTLQKLRGTIGTINVCEHTGLISFSYKGVTFQLGKNKLMGIYSQSTISKKKMTYKVDADTEEEQCNIISKKVEEIRKEIDDRLGEVCSLLSITICSEIEWVRYEDWGRGIEIIDKIPKDTIIHCKHWKKVYPEGIELLKAGKDDKTPPGVKLNNMIENYALNRHTPQLAKELVDIKSTMVIMSDHMLNQSENIKYLTENINAHIPAIVKLGENAEKQGRSSERLADSVERLTNIVRSKEKKYKHPSELMDLPNSMRGKYP